MSALLETITPAPLAFRIGRYSAKDGDRRLDRQAADTLTLCEASGYDDGGWFGVDDESGNVDTRRRQGKSDRSPTLAWAMAQITAAKLVDPDRPIVLVAWKEARLFRDVAEKESIRRFLAEWPDTTFHTYDGILNPRGANDTLRSTITTAANQHYSDSVREGVMRAHDQRIAEGMPAAGAPIFGYKLEADGSWSVVEENAQLVRKAINDLLAGVALSTIAKEWDAAGVPTVRGGKWDATGIRSLVANPRLAGILTRNGKEVGQGAWEPIVDELTFRRVQRMIEGRVRGEKVGARVLTGLLFCSNCNNEKYLNSTQKRNRTVYYCRHCRKMQLNAEIAERIYVTNFFAALEDPAFVESLIAGEDTSRIYAEIQAQTADMAELEAAAADLPVKAYVAKAQSIDAKLNALRAKLAKIDNATAITSWVGRVAELRAKWDGMDTDKKRTLLLEVVGPASVLPGEQGKRLSEDYVRARLTRLPR